MTNTSVQRRLAAILAADVVAYSRLMQADEVGTLEALKAHRRELIDPVSPVIADGSSRRLAMAHSSNLPALSMRSGVRWLSSVA